MNVWETFAFGGICVWIHFEYIKIVVKQICLKCHEAGRPVSACQARWVCRLTLFSLEFARFNDSGFGTPHISTARRPHGERADFSWLSRNPMTTHTTKTVEEWKKQIRCLFGRQTSHVIRVHFWISEKGEVGKGEWTTCSDSRFRD